MIGPTENKRRIVEAVTNSRPAQTDSPEPETDAAREKAVPAKDQAKAAEPGAGDIRPDGKGGPDAAGAGRPGPGPNRGGPQGPARQAAGNAGPRPGPGRAGPQAANRGPGPNRQQPASDAVEGNGAGKAQGPKEGGASPAAARKGNAAETAAQQDRATAPDGSKPGQAQVPATVKENPVAKAEPHLPAKQQPAQPPQPPYSGPSIDLSVIPPASPRKRHKVALITFFLIVVLPSLVAFWYLFARAEDRYASDAAFYVHREDASPSVATLFGLSGLNGSTSTPDADVVYQYISSQQMVQKIDARLNLRAMFGPYYKQDPVFALDPDASLEDLVDFWQRIITLDYATDTGVITLEVRAYTPEDAQKIANAILDESGALIEKLSQIAQADSIKEAQQDLDDAETQVKNARIKIAEFRTAHNIVDPSSDVAGQEGLITALDQQLANALIGRDALNGTTSRPDDPRLVQADRTIDAIRKRISEERDKVGNNQAGVVGKYEALMVDQQFAEQAYTAARAAKDTAVAEARRKNRYLAVHLAPTLAQTAQYPERVLLGLLCTAFLFLAWTLVVLVFYSIRDRR